MSALLPCPFCGSKLDLEDEDTLYPTGDGWLFDEELQMRTYHRLYIVPKEQWCYALHCSCGASLTGDDRDEVIEKWNRRKQ